MAADPGAGAGSKPIFNSHITRDTSWQPCVQALTSRTAICRHPADKWRMQRCYPPLATSMQPRTHRQQATLTGLSRSNSGETGRPCAFSLSPWRKNCAHVGKMSRSAHASHALVLSGLQHLPPPPGPSPTSHLPADAMDAAVGRFRISCAASTTTCILHARTSCPSKTDPRSATLIATWRLRICSLGSNGFRGVTRGEASG